MSRPSLAPYLLGCAEFLTDYADALDDQAAVRSGALRSAASFARQTAAKLDRDLAHLEEFEGVSRAARTFLAESDSQDAGHALAYALRMAACAVG